MKKFFTPFLLGLSIIVSTLSVNAQSVGTRPDKLYSMSGLGFAFPVGETADYLKPKFSTSIGLNVGLGNSGLFLYPKVSLHAYGYKELSPDAGYTYALQKGRATTYLLNVALGYRVFTGKFSFYGFAGGGGGIILTPRIAVNQATLQAELSNKSNSMGIMEGGLGTELNLGTLVMFAEVSYMHGFSEIQNRAFNSAPVTVGIKPNLAMMFKKK